MIKEELKQKREQKRKLYEQAKQDGVSVSQLEKQLKNQKSSTKLLPINQKILKKEQSVQVIQTAISFPQLINKLQKSSLAQQQQNQNAKSIQSLKQKNKDNMHENFLDLNPVYFQQRHQRAVKLANFWMKDIKSDIKAQVNQKARQIFNQQIRNGRDLTYEELQNLNEDWKNDYIKNQLLEDKVVQKYSQFIQIKGENTIDKVEEAKMKVEDVQDKWQDEMKQFNNKVEKKMADCGIIQKKDLKNYFQEFDIQDMDKNNQSCWACKKGIKCPKHVLEKKSQIQSKKN